MRSSRLASTWASVVMPSLRQLRKDSLTILPVGLAIEYSFTKRAALTKSGLVCRLEQSWSSPQFPRVSGDGPTPAERSQPNLSKTFWGAFATVWWPLLAASSSSSFSKAGEASKITSVSPFSSMVLSVETFLRQMGHRAIDFWQDACQCAPQSD